MGGCLPERGSPFWRVQGLRQWLSGLLSGKWGFWGHSDTAFPRRLRLKKRLGGVESGTAHFLNSLQATSKYHLFLPRVPSTEQR